MFADVVKTLTIGGDAIYSPQSLLLAGGGAFIVVGEATSSGSGILVIDTSTCSYFHRIVWPSESPNRRMV